MGGDIEVRRLGPDDLATAWELSRLAFGQPAGPPPEFAMRMSPHVIRHGAFDSAGRLLGRAVDLHHEQWWGGRRLAAADVAGVAVAPEARGRGVARALMHELLRTARERGAALSALYPTTSVPYRSLGWELTGAMSTIDISTAYLVSQRPSAGLRIRAAEPADMPAVHGLYERVARSRNGMLTRDGGLFTLDADRLPAGLDGITLVEDDTGLVGYASWERGTGYDDSSVLHVPDAIALTPGAATALVDVLAGWRSVAPTLRLRLLASDAVTARIPMEETRDNLRQRWMHRPVDVVRAVEGRGWPSYVHGAVEFALDDAAAPWNAGWWRLEMADGKATLTSTSNEPTLRLTVRGFALLYAGAARASALVEAGLLHCPADESPDALDLLAVGPPAELLNYF